MEEHCRLVAFLLSYDRYRAPRWSLSASDHEPKPARGIVAIRLNLLSPGW